MTARKNYIVWLLIAATAIVAAATISRSRAEPSATQPAPSISPQAQALLAQMRDAYSSLKSLAITGKLQGHFDIDGVQRDEQSQFNGLYTAAGLFRHEMKDSSARSGGAATQPAEDVVIGNTGDKIYLFLPSRNRYTTVDAPADKIDLDSIGDDVADILREQDLPLALTISGDAPGELARDAISITRIDDVKIDGAACPAILVSRPLYDLTLVIDPQTHLLRREIVDLTRNAKAKGAQDVKAALLTLDCAGTPNAPLQPAQFAWSPPPGAQELQQAADSESQLVGKNAPPFTLNGLDGKPVSSQQLKGSVYVLDFWATWCGPCVMSLPQLDQIYKDLKGSGLKVFAVNQQEDKAAVQKFVSDTKLTIPVLLDTDAGVGGLYDLQNAIPCTVVVGKDGKVCAATIGAGQDEQIRRAVQDALKN